MLRGVTISVPAACRFLFNMGQAKSRWYVINGLLMLASFALFRNVLGVGERPAVCPSTVYVCATFLDAWYIINQGGFLESAAVI